MTLGSHQKMVGGSQDWITPRFILDALGHFDLDPCAALPAPWQCAKHQICLPADGLALRWPKEMRVWLNPPFDRYQVGKWIRRLASHGIGTALLHARTETEWFKLVWQHASAILFLADRLYFHYPDGRRAEANSGAPACLVAFGKVDARRLAQSGLAGYLVTRWQKLPA